MSGVSHQEYSFKPWIRYPAYPQVHADWNFESRVQLSGIVVTFSYLAATITRQTRPYIGGRGRGLGCAHIVLNSTSLQLIPAYSSQSSLFS